MTTRKEGYRWDGQFWKKVVSFTDKPTRGYKGVTTIVRSRTWRIVKVIRGAEHHQFN